MKKLKAIWAIWIFAVILSAVLLSAKVSALGITPGRTVMDFEEGKTKDITFTVINNEHKDMKVMIYVDEEDAKFMDMKPVIVEMKADEASKDFKSGLKMPKNILKPGMNEIGIRVLELPQSYGEDSNAKVTATMEVVHQLRINVPYPGKYAESEVYISSQDHEKPILFTIPIFNRGKERIESAKAVIEIFDAAGRNVAIVGTNEISLGPGGEGKVTAEVFTKLGRGRYMAKVHLTYDSMGLEMEKEFFIGVPLVNINAVMVDSSFRLGGIAKFSILLENMWNQNIENAYCDISIKDQNNRGIASLKTASKDIDANSIGKLEAYWDTKDLNPGVYRMDVILHYASLVTEKVFDMDVGFDSIKIREYGATGAVVAGKGDEGSWLNSSVILVLAVLVLIAINIMLLLYLKKRGKRPESPF